MNSEAHEDTPDQNPWTITVPDCVVCDDLGCEWCHQAPEPWPMDVFEHLGLMDLQRLILDAKSALYRKQREAWGS